MRLSPSIRLRLTLFYVGLLVGGTTLLLVLSWWLLGNHLERTLPPEYADHVLGQLATQYALAIAGTALVALGVGWLAAGRRSGSGSRSSTSGCWSPGRRCCWC